MRQEFSNDFSRVAHKNEEDPKSKDTGVEKNRLVVHTFMTCLNIRASVLSVHVRVLFYLLRR